MFSFGLKQLMIGSFKGFFFYFLSTTDDAFLTDYLLLTMMMMTRNRRENRLFRRQGNVGKPVSVHRRSRAADSRSEPVGPTAEFLGESSFCEFLFCDTGVKELTRK